MNLQIWLKWVTAWVTYNNKNKRTKFLDLKMEFGTAFNTPFALGNIADGIEMIFNALKPRKSSTESSDSFDPSKDRIIGEEKVKVKNRRQSQ